MGFIKAMSIMVLIILSIVLITGVLTKECDTGETRICDTGLNGPCEIGKQYCERGMWTQCIVTTEPTQEYCDGIDNDCDGTTDEDCWVCKPGEREQCGDTDKGACEYGLQTCRDDGQWGPCIGSIEPTTEICFNNKDDDCDGEVDENCGECYPGEEKRCGKTDIGICEYGLQTCDADGQWGACKGAVFASPEKCGNNLDDDCDGQIDEGCAVCADGDTRQCGFNDVGRCEYGIETCMNGSWGNCVGAVYPVNETCNGKDDDCDGEVDEGCGMTFCGNGLCDHFERTLDVAAPPESFSLYGGNHTIDLINVTSASTAVIEIDGNRVTLTRGVEEVVDNMEVMMDQLQYTPAIWDWANVRVGETADNCPQDC